jgi:nucleotide-binding universal stress UspA family protein
MKILFAVDGSDRALAALDLLIARLDWFKDRPSITLVNVHAPLPYGMATAWVGRENVQSYYQEESQKALKPAVERLAAKGLAPDAVTLVGDPAEEIAKYATGHGHDLIAMGTHGRTALSNLVMGSVATKVLATSKVPVLFVR